MYRYTYTSSLSLPIAAPLALYTNSVSALVKSLARRARNIGTSIESWYDAFDFAVDLYAGIAAPEEIKLTSALARPDRPIWHPYCNDWRYYSRRVMSSGINVLFGRWVSSYASTNIFSIMRILLLEWEISHTPAAMILLSAFEDPGSDELDSAVFSMQLDAFELHNYYLLAVIEANKGEDAEKRVRVHYMQCIAVAWISQFNAQ